MKKPIFSYPLIIKEFHLDTFGHVNNAMYVALFEEARWEFITQNGYGHAQIMETGLSPVILEIKIRFLEEIRLRQAVVIEIDEVSYRGKIGKITQRITRDGKTCCEGEFIIGLFDLQQRKLVKPTPEWLRAIGLAAS